jgi:hypothetical protein
VNAIVNIDLLRSIARHRRARFLLLLLVDTFTIRRDPPLLAQLAFGFALPAPARGPLFDSDIVRCDHFACMMPARTCIARQAARWPGKKAAVYLYCASGVCEQGAGYARRATWDPRSGWSKGRFSFYRQDSKEQHAARKRLVAENGLQRSQWTEADELVQIGAGSVNVRTRARKGT